MIEVLNRMREESVPITSSNADSYRTALAARSAVSYAVR